MLTTRVARRLARASPETCRRGCSTQATRGVVYYQSHNVPASIRSTGLVGTDRNLQGSDGEFFGTDPAPVEVQIENGRDKGFTLDENGFCLLKHKWDHIDYFNNDEIVNTYYAECEAVVTKATGASRAIAFDHNLRAKQRKQAGDSLEGGSAVQEPLISYGVHNDYTATSAPERIRQLAKPPGNNDTWRYRLTQCKSGAGLLKPQEVDRLLRGRWQFVNVWRNVTENPVERFPLAACDARSTALDQLVVFEIRYADRVGENYFVRHAPGHRWHYFPRMTRDEVFLLKCWDSRGRDFLDASDETGSVPATFSLHTAFDDVATPKSAPDRESLEVRTVAFFEE